MEASELRIVEPLLFVLVVRISYGRLGRGTKNFAAVLSFRFFLAQMGKDLPLQL